ncbi:MAG: CBS domain-containing protein [Anaerolineales bacterium]|nr:CBS domain-containing protein [Anaerolineales bacterium]
MTETEDTSSILLVRNLMAVGVPTCSLDTPVIDLARKMLDNDWEAVAVLESEQGHAVGVVSRAALIEAFAHGVREGISAEDIMKPGLPTVPPDIPLTAAAQIMLDLQVRAIYVTHHAGGIEYPAAWLTYTHLLRRLVGDPVEDLGIRAERELPMETFFKRRDEARKKAGLG